MFIKSRQTESLDGKKAWDAWRRPGMSLEKVRALPEFVNPNTGRPYSKRNIQVQAYKYVMRNQTHSRPEWEQTLREAGEVPAPENGETRQQAWDKEWRFWLMKMAQIVYRYQTKAYEGFIKENGLEAHE